MNELLKEDKDISKVISYNNHYELDQSMLIIPPHSEDYENIFVPKRFLENVACHIIAPYLQEDKQYKPPIYLAIKGLPGQGKTAQSIATCTQKGGCVIYVSASTLSGSHENEAKEKLQRIYNKAIELRTKVLTTIIIDDFHKGILNEDENIKKTINSDILTGYMMNIAEHNGSVHIPIILTANDLSQIYAPLLRAGRADVFLWEPKQEEKREIVFRIISSFLNDKNEKKFNSFFRRYNNENIAFFAQLKNQWRKVTLKDCIHDISDFNSENIQKINNIINSYKYNLTYNMLNDIAELLIKERNE
jgi:AAA+ superfamily predicted ATPase